MHLSSRVARESRGPSAEQLQSSKTQKNNKRKEARVEHCQSELKRISRSESVEANFFSLRSLYVLYFARSCPLRMHQIHRLPVNVHTTVRNKEATLLFSIKRALHVIET